MIFVKLNKIFGLSLLFVIVIDASTISCKDKTTYGLMDCQKVELEKYTKKMHKYFIKALQIQEDKKLIEIMKKSQVKWVAYEDSECRAVYQIWAHGTIRGLMAGGCMLRMIKQRTHDIWENYLNNGELSSTILPEPIFEEKK